MGFEWLELHFAHGYLGQSFFSAHSNQRTDEYGGSAENRGRFLIETLAAVRKVWPEHLPLTARFGVIEFDGRDEETLAESIALARRFKAEGLDFIDVSMGFYTPTAKSPGAPILWRGLPSGLRREPVCRARRAGISARRRRRTSSSGQNSRPCDARSAAAG